MRRVSRPRADVASLRAQLLADVGPWLPADKLDGEAAEAANPYAPYQTDPIGYAEQVLGLTPWSGTREKGQRELFADIADSVRRQLAGMPAPHVFRVEAANGVGKTFAGAMLVNWWFDAFAPSICITTAPTKTSVVELLWKDIKKMRPAHLPGRVLPSEPRMVKAANHWAIGKTTSDSGGKGEERFKGQHDQYLLFVLDEAEGLARFVFDAVHRMMTGGRVILTLLFANPRTRTSEFYRWGQKPGVVNYRLSALDYPNVIEDAEVVPGGTSRAWVDANIDAWCEPVGVHCADEYTFEVPWRPGAIYRPNAEFLCAVMGIPPANNSDDTLIPSGRYEVAVGRGRDREIREIRENEAKSGESAQPAAGGALRIGVDVARWGLDHGTIYARWGDLVWRVAKISRQDTTAYAAAIRAEALRIAALPHLASPGPLSSLHVRVDGGGGFGGGVIDQLRGDPELKAVYRDFRCIEVNFNGKPHDARAYADLITNLYADVAESLRGLAILHPPEELGPDLTERRYLWVNVAGVAVKRLEPKDEVRKSARLGRSPDDGDGFVLACASDFVFVPVPERAIFAPTWGKARRSG